MGRAKDIIVRPISATDARRIITTMHYSGKVVTNSQVHFGVFLDGRCGGALQFGPPLNSKGMVSLVRGTRMREMIELNRMALADWLPRNGESRVLAVSMRLLRKHYPHLKWIVSFADACQCGDGAIYRAAGFLLTDIRPNEGLRRNPETGEVVHAIAAHHKKQRHLWQQWEPLTGYQLRYVYFLHPKERENLAVEAIPYSRINELGIGMYKGEKVVSGGSIVGDAPGYQSGEGGSIPTPPLSEL